MIVRKRRVADSDDDEEPAEERMHANESYISQVGAMLNDDDEHCDITFYAGEVRSRLPLQPTEIGIQCVEMHVPLG